MAQAQTITLENIMSSPRLQELGVQPGDKIAGNNLVRIFSSEEDSRDIGQRLTEQDVASSARLQELGAAAGDRIVDNKLIDSGSDDTIQQFMYGFDKAGNFIGYTTDILRSVAPFGEVDFNTFRYIPSEEAYGEGFNDADFDTRREMILRKRERDLMQEYGPYFEPQEGTAQTIGEITGTLADPTTLLPVGQSIKAAAAIGGALGLSYSAAEDLAVEGKIDPAKAAVHTALGGVGGALFPIAGKAVRALRERGGKEVVSDTALAFEETAEKSVDDAIVNDSAWSRTVGPMSENLDKYLGNISTRIRNISEPVLGRLRAYERDIRVRTADELKAAEPFMRQLKTMPKPRKEQVARHLFNQDFKQAEALMDEPMKVEFETVKTQLKTLLNEQKEIGGVQLNELTNYFPRSMRNYSQFRASLGTEPAGVIDTALEEYAKRKQIDIRDIDDLTREEIVNKALRGYGQKMDANLPPNSRKRTIRKLTDQTMPFYRDPEEALHLYIRNAVNNIERGRFLGRGTKRDDMVLDDDGIDLRSSIGKVVDREIQDGNLNTDQQLELKQLLESRFMGGERSSSSPIGFLRDLGYMGTIANPISAITQLGDLAMSAAKYGLSDTIAAMLNTKNIKLVDQGLDTISAEFTNVRKTAKLLDQMFTKTGFKAVDRLGKETVMNASLRKNQKMVKTALGEQAFRKRWSKFYGDEIDGLVSDLQSGRITEAVKLHAFNELSDVQPITLLELPEGYLKNPNGRILYALKSFTLKQYDIVRRDIVQEYKKGNKLAAAKKAAVLASYLAAANVGTQTAKDFLLGRDVRAEDLPNNSMWALLGVFGVNKYMSDKYLSEGKFTDAAIETLAPATPIIDAVLGGTAELTQEDPNLSQYARSIPVIGPMLYNWFLGGAEKYNERLAKEG